MKRLLFAAACSMSAASMMAAEVSITLPPETAALKNGAGLETAQTSCLLCHSVDYISTQPKMPRKFWEASVKKMREKYGAPIPEDSMPALLDYLVGTYGVK